MNNEWGPWIDYIKHASGKKIRSDLRNTSSDLRHVVTAAMLVAKWSLEYPERACCAGCQITNVENRSCYFCFVRKECAVLKTFNGNSEQEANQKVLELAKRIYKREYNKLNRELTKKQRRDKC